MVSFKKLRQMMKAQGSGTLAMREQAVSSFTRLHLSSHGTVELVQSDEEKVVVEVDDNLLDYIQVVNSGRTLYVTTENKLRNPDFTSLRVTVHLRQLDMLDVAGQGNVVCANALTPAGGLTVKVRSIGDTDLWVETPTLTVSTACQGNVTLRGTAGEVSIKTASEGHLDAAGLVAQHLKVRHVSQGNLTLYAAQTIAITHLGQGFIHYAGPARLTDVRQHGQGEIRHIS